MNRSACSGGSSARRAVRSSGAISFRTNLDSSSENVVRTCLLRVEIEIGEGLGGPLRLDQPQHVHLLGARQRIDQLGQVGGKPAVERLAQRVSVAERDQLANRRQRQLSQHDLSTRARDPDRSMLREGLWQEPSPRYRAHATVATEFAG